MVKKGDRYHRLTGDEAVVMEVRDNGYVWLKVHWAGTSHWFESHYPPGKIETEGGWIPNGPTQREP